VKILSIDGGGIRGLLPALVLAEFESQTGRPIAKSFDLIAGTSTGGILALGLAAGIPAMRLAEFYLERGPAIFSRSLKKRIESVGGLTDEMYGAGELEIALVDLFGDRTLSSVEPHAHALAVAYDIEARETMSFCSWGGEDFRLADVGRATSAAPTYFEPFMLKSLKGVAMPCIDGGVVANNPSMIAYLLWGAGTTDAKNIRLVSLGTGRRDTPLLLSDARGFGLAQWAPHLVDIMFSGSSELIHEQCARLLGENYLRLQADLPEDVPMDGTDAKHFAVLKLAAKRLAASPEASRALAIVRTA